MTGTTKPDDIEWLAVVFVVCVELAMLSAVGAGVGAMVGGMDRSCTFEWGSLCTLTGAVVMAPVGLLAGLFIGAVVTTDRWEEVPLDAVSLRFEP